MKYKSDVCIVGGLGHVGLPLGIVLASKGLDVCLQDINTAYAEIVRRGEMPFVDYGAEPLLKKVLDSGKLTISIKPESIADARYVIIAVGTPIDRYLNPKTREFLEFIQDIKEYLNPSQVIIVRSSLYPNTYLQILRLLGIDYEWQLTYCPERIAQGYFVQEIGQIPQIVSGYSDKATTASAELFQLITKEIIFTSVEEAELAKLFSNSWRYIQFASANQFYMICENFGVDYDRVRHIITKGYERAKELPPAGFSAGPCLLKDTMQLSAFDSGNFVLGQAAMTINESLPKFIADKLHNKFNLSQMTVGILGMAFKANVDDIRDSLSYKLGKILRFYGANVLYSDEFAKDRSFVTKDELIDSSNIVIIGTPHSVYSDIVIPDHVELVDLWGCVNN